MAGYYRPVIDSNTASTIDANALKGAISSMGSFFGQGQLKTRPKQSGGTVGNGENVISESGMGGQPDMEYYTTGGRFWDRLNNRQAEMANAQLQGRRFNQQLDLFGNQQELGQQSAFNSAERLGINRDANANAASTYNFNQANPQLPQAIAQAIQKVMLQGQLAGQTAANNSGATTEGIIAQHRRPGLENQQIQAATGHTNQQTDDLRTFQPFKVLDFNYNNLLKQRELNNAPALQQAQLDQLKSTTEMNRAHAKHYETEYNKPFTIAGPGLIIDNANRTLNVVPPYMTNERDFYTGYTNAVPTKGLWDPSGSVRTINLDGIPRSVGYTNPPAPGRVGSPYGKTISAEKLKKLQAILNEP